MCACVYDGFSGVHQAKQQQEHILSLYLCVCIFATIRMELTDMKHPA